MWRSKIAWISCRLSSALNPLSTSRRCPETIKVRIAATTHQNQVFSPSPVRLYSSLPIHYENFVDPNTNTIPYVKNNYEHDSGKPEGENTQTLETLTNSNPAKKYDEDAEKVVSILKKKLELQGLEAELQTLDLDIKGKMIAKVVKTPGFRTEQFVNFFRWAIKQPDYVPSTNIMDNITVAICNKGGRKGLDLLKILMEDVAANHKGKGLISAPALNTLIRRLGREEKAKEALEVFKQFNNKFECKPATKSYLLTITELCKASMFDEAFSVFEDMEKAGCFPGNGSTVSKIIRLFCKANRPKDAFQVYLKSKEKGKLPRLVGMSALVDSLCNVAKTPEVSAKILGDIPRKERKHTLKPHFTVVRAFCNNQQVEEAQALFSQMVRVGPRPDRATYNAIYNAIISALCRAEKADEAMGLLEQMTSRRIRTDIYAYNVIMASFARAGRMQEACDVFSRAKEANIKFHFITYKILIDGYCRLGEPEKAYQYFYELKESGRSPNQEVYANLVRAYTLQGSDLDTAKKLVHEMEQKGHSHTSYTQNFVHATEELEEKASQGEACKIRRAPRSKR